MLQRHCEFAPRMSFRQEITSIVTQVVKLTGGEKGDGEGAISPPEPPALGTADLSGDDTPPDDTGHGHRAPVPRQGVPSGGDGGVAAAAGEAAAEVGLSSRPELLLTLKENLESLGLNRAALKRDNLEGAGAGTGTSGSRGSRNNVDEGDDGARVRQLGHAADDDDARGDANRTLTTAAGRAAVGVATGVETESAEKEESTPERTPTAATAGLSMEGTIPGCGGGDDDQLRVLHEAYIARPEPSLLPLYPPGDSFLLRSDGDHDGFAAARGGEVSGGGGGGDIGVPDEQGGLGTGQSIEASVSRSATSSRSASSAAAAPASAHRDGGRADSNARGAATPAPRAVEGSGAVLVRVPHEHFLRMPLSPSMLEHHSISSYQRALEGLSSYEKKPGRA